MTIKEKVIKINDTDSIKIYLIKEDKVFVVHAVEWTTRIDGIHHTSVGAQKFHQIFADVSSATEYFDNIIDKWS